MNWQRWRGLIHAAVALALLLSYGGVSFLSSSQVEAGTPDDSYTIERYYTENAAIQSTSSTTYVDAVTMAFTPPNTANYTVIASALTNNDSTSNSTVVQLLIDGTGYSEAYHTPIDTTLNWRSFGTQKVELFDSTSHTVKIQYRTTDAANDAYIQKAFLSVVEVTNVHNAESNAPQDNSTTGYVDAVSLTFNVPTTADYLILNTANLKNSGATKSSYMRLLIDAAEDTELEQVGTSYMSWGNMERENLTTGSHTLQIQFKTQGGSTATIKHARVTAILLSDLGSNNYAETEAESKTTSITYVDKTTLPLSPTTPNDWLVIGSYLGRQEANPHAFYGNLDIDGISYGEYVFVPPAANTVYRSYMGAPKVNLPAGSYNIKIQYKTSNQDSKSEVFIKNANAIAIKVDTAESYDDSNYTTVDNDFVFPQNTVYIWAHGLKAIDNYSVGYYDGSGDKVASDGPKSSTSYGNLSSQYLLTTHTDAVFGTWHAVVFDTNYGSPSENYTAAATNPGYVVEDSFGVQASAIPEFPTVMAGIMVAGLCFGIYYWMRKRRLAYVKA